MSEYGLLAGLVGSVGALLGAGGAITLAWKRTSNWTPPEDDVPSGPSKVASVLTAIGVSGLWYETGKALSSRDLQEIAGAAGAILVIALIVYAMLMSIFIYDKEVVKPGGGTEIRKTIGGFWLTSYAKERLRDAKTVQRLFAGSAYDPDLLWPRLSRALVKALFTLSFMTLLVSGSVAISSIALSTDPSASAPPADSNKSGTSQLPASKPGPTRPSDQGKNFTPGAPKPTSQSRSSDPIR